MSNTVGIPDTPNQRSSEPSGQVWRGWEFQPLWTLRRDLPGHPFRKGPHNGEKPKRGTPTWAEHRPQRQKKDEVIQTGQGACCRLISEVKLPDFFITLRTCKHQKRELWKVRTAVWTQPSKCSRKLISRKMSIRKVSRSNPKPSYHMRKED